MHVTFLEFSYQFSIVYNFFNSIPSIKKWTYGSYGSKSTPRRRVTPNPIKKRQRTPKTTPRSRKRLFLQLSNTKSRKSPWKDYPEEEELLLDTGSNDDVHSMEDGLSEEARSFINMANDRDVIDSLEKSNYLIYFTLFFGLVKKGTYPLSNIAFLLWLETVRWYSRLNTRHMWYWEQTKSFWRAGYRLFKGKFISFMSGPRNSCQIDKTDPNTSEINFAVPSRTTLLDTRELQIPAVMNPGVIGASLDAISKSGVSKTNMLCLDDKKVTAGLSDECGDVNMFGFEHPNFNQMQGKLKTELRYVQEMKDIALDITNDTVKANLHSKMKMLITILFHRIKDARNLQVKQLYGLEKLKERAGPEWKTSKYVFAISGIQAFIYRVKDFIRRTLCVIGLLCNIGSNMQHDINYVSSSEIDPQFQSNLFLLKDVKTQTKPIPTHFIKQRSEEWHSVRQTTRVTGSTIHNAIGLRSLKDQKEHFDKFVSKNTAVAVQSHDDLTLQRMAHGTKHEPDAVATIASKYLPMFHPNTCFTEEGCYILASSTTNQLLTVSPDGSIRTLDTPSSIDTSFSTPGTCLLAVEIKCPYPKPHGDHIYYKLPRYYICQCLAEMKALNVQKLLFVCYSSESTVFSEVSFDGDLWNEILGCVDNLYGKSEPKRPTRLLKDIRELKHNMDNFVENNVTLIAEVPSATVVQSDTSAGHNNTSSPYLATQPLNLQRHRNMSDVSTDLMLALLEAEECIQMGYQLSRRKANEVMVWVASNKDRFFSPEIPNSLPIAYGMKDYTLSETSLRAACNVVLSECVKRGLKIPLLAFDGQWYQLMVRDNHGRPLTNLQLQRDTWNNVLKLKKAEVVDKLRILNKVTEDNHENVLYERVGARIEVKSRDHAFSTVRTNLKVSLWKKKGSHVSVAEEDTQSDENVDIDWIPETVLKLVEERGDRELLETIHSITKDVNVLLQNEQYGERKDDEEETTEKSLSASSSKPTEVTEIFVITDDILVDIHVKLESLSRGKKWKGCSLEQLRDCLISAESMTIFTVPEIDAIVDILNQPGKVYKKSWTKTAKINHLSSMIGDGTELQSTGSCRKKKVLPLSSLAEKVLRSKHVPKTILSVAYAQYQYPFDLDKWIKDSPVGYSHTLSDVERDIVWYSHPERSEITGDLLCKCLDSHHLLTNLRIKTSTTGIKNISPIAWKKVANSHCTNLTPAMVDDLVDKQSNAFALTHFSEEVESAMIRNGDLKEASFCRLIRRWYEADDLPAITFSERVSRWLDLRDYMLKDVQFHVFPPPTSFVNGLSTIAFEGFMTGIDSKIQLHAMCGPYCVRTASSLPAETIVGGIQDLNVNNTPSVKACDIPRIMSALTEIMTYKCNPER